MIVSRRLRDSAGHHNAYCTLQIAGVCPDATDSKTAGCMLCHIRIAGDVGGAQKPDDLTAVLGCGPCHAVFDANGNKGLPVAEWQYYAMRAWARTLRFWHENGFITIS